MASTNITYKISLIDLLSPALRNANNEADKLDKKMSHLRNNTTKNVGMMGRSFSSLGGLVKLAFGAAAIRGVIGFGKYVMDAGQQVESATAGLTTTLKDANLAREVINNSMIDAAKTPFDFGQIAMANQMFTSAGESVEKARKSTLDLANALAAVGRTTNPDDWKNLVVNLQTIRTTGKATMQDFKQFGVRGIDMNALMIDTFGKNLAMLKKEGPITADMIELALSKAASAGGRYADGLKNSMNTVSGVISKVRDTAFQAASAIFLDNKDEILAVVQLISDGMVKAIPIVSQIIEGIKAVIVFLKPVFDVISTQVTNIMKTFKESGLFESLISNIQMLQEPLMTLFTVVGEIITVIIEFAGWLNKTFGILDYIFSRVIKAVRVIGSVWEMIKNTIEVIKAIFAGDWEKAFNKYLDGFGKFYNVLIDLWDFLFGDNEKKEVTAVKKVEKQAEKVPKGVDRRKPMPVIPPEEKKTKGVTGTKITTINIYMENMIESFVINPNTMKEGGTDAKDIVVKALTQAIGDSQLILR